MQDSATAQCSGEMGHRIRAEHPDIDPPIISQRMRLAREMFERFGLTAQCLGCRATRTGIGHPANHTERCRERMSPGSLATERIKRARHEERARDVRVEDL